jgi:pimeloyl-ACP methyl ester carboxylesterase
MLVLASGCPSVKTDPGQTQGTLPPVDGPTVEFDPANSIVPFPSNLVLDPASGRVKIPAPACETPTAMALRTSTLNTLNGFGTYETAMQVTLTKAVDASTLPGHVVMYERLKGTTPTTPGTAQQVPVAVKPSVALRFDASSCATPATVDALEITPLVPLDESSTYTIALLSGIKDADGNDYLPSFTWALVRQKDEPVTIADGCDPTTYAGCVVTANQTPIDASTKGGLAQLVGLDELWKAHAPAMSCLESAGQKRSDVLVAWEITTQTTTDPLDPMVAASPAASLASAALLGTQSVAQGGCNAGTGCTAFLTAAGLPCGPSFPCDKVGDVLGAALYVGDSTYQTHVPNTLSGGADVPGPWSDPYSPTVQSPFDGPIGAGRLEVIATVPTGTPPTAAGWPVVVFGHGLGSSKETVLAIAPQLAAAGYATVAIDFVDHGSRAVRTSVDPALGCGPGHCSATTTQSCDPTAPGAVACPSGESCVGAPTPTAQQQCFAPFLSTDLATTRDNIRQTVLDLQRLVKAVRACGTTKCGELAIDPTHVEYAGISLGGIIGSTTSSVIQPPFNGAVLNVSGVGLVDILENTPNLTIRCTLVNQLIDAGILVGQKWDPSNPTVGLCTTDAWRDPTMQPGYAQFAGVARWVLDPADGANFTAKLATRRFLLQEVVDDQVVPNIATDNEGMLVGLTAGTADPFTPATTMASAALLANLNANTWLRYPKIDGTATTFGNLFQHASLLQPAASPGQCSNDPATTCTASADCGAGNVCVFPGVLGTARVQLDAITFLKANE